MNNNVTDSAKDNYKDNRNEFGQPGSNSNNSDNTQRKVVKDLLDKDEQSWI